MAAIYDALGNVVGDDSAPSLDQMNLALTKSNRLTPQQMERFVAPQPLASQIPGYGKPVPPAQTPPATNPLEFAAGNFTQLATNFNPLMMMKSMKEAAGILTVPPVAAIKGVGESLFTSPPGTFISGQAPAYAENVAKQFMEQNAPQTPVTQAFANAISPLMADLPAYLGHLQTGRPALTPNDVRVMGAEATRMGRQVRDIPSDFANAQSGMQRIDPITGQPTYGAKLQGVADSIGDIMAQREMQGLPPIPGLPASMQPMNPKLYAMRPEGSRIQSAVIPPTANTNSVSYSPARDLVENLVKTEPLTPVEVLDEIQNNVLRKNETLPAREAFTNFLKQKANEMYPDAPSEGAALAAYKLKFGNKAASAPNTLDLYYQFLQTPEGIQYRVAHNLPSPDEVVERHNVASDWLNSQFTNYINEKVGTPNEPAAKLAAQGFTFATPQEIFDVAQHTAPNVAARRAGAGMPVKTATDEALTEAEQKVSDLSIEAASAADRKREQEAIAKQLGYGAIDPNTGVPVEGMNLGRYEPYAQASREAAKVANDLKKQRQKYENLKLGSAYEKATDYAINAQTAKELTNELEYAERQFYPSLLRTPEDERVYTASTRQLRNLGFEDLARKFYNDVMSGDLPTEKVKNMTVEKYIRQAAEKRIAEEKLAQAKAEQYKNDVNNQFLESTKQYVPLDKTYRNVGALEVTNKKFNPEQTAKILSEDTLALDVCIAEGGNAVDTPNLWFPGTGNRQYIPQYDVVTGQKNPDATSPRMTFINAVKKGDQMVSFRDLATGMPAAIFQFEKVSPNKYHIGFASGRQNSFVQPEYAEGIKDYLNARADQIQSTSANLERNLGIYDKDRVNAGTLAQAANVPTTEFRYFDLSSLPRFVTSRDLQDFVANLRSNQPPAVVPEAANQQPSRSLEAYATNIVFSAIDNVLESQRRAFETQGIEDRFQGSEDFFADIRAQFNESLREHGPVPAFEMIIEELMSLEGQYSNSTRPSHNIIAQGIIDLIQHLDLTSEYLRLRAAADAAQTPYAVGQNGRVQYLRMTHDAFMQAERQYGIEAADEMRSTVRSIIEQQGFDPQTDTDRFITSLRVAADDADRGTVEIALSELADQMESAYMQDWEPDVAHAANAPAPQAVQPFDWIGALDSLANEVSQNTNPGVGNRVDTIAHRVAERINPRLDPAGYAAALRAVDFTNEHVAVGPALRQLALAIEAEPTPAQQAQNIVPRGNDVEPEELRDSYLSGARVRLDDANYATVESHINSIGQYINSREEPEEFASMLRQAADDIADVNARDILNSYANQVINLYGTPDQQQPVNFRPATQDQASAALMQINREIGNQARLLSDEHNEAITQLFATSIGRLYSENNLNEVGDTPASLTRFGYYLQGYRDDLAAQIPYLNREGFMGVAAASAIQNVINAIDTQLVDFRSRPTEDVQARTEQSLIQEVRSALDNNELGAEDLRRMAGSMEPFVGDPRWGALSEQTRRTAIRDLRAMANFIEFSPRDFAQQLMNEEGPEHYNDAITLLHNNDYDHPVLQGLPPAERGRAAQGTALAMERMLVDEPQLRALNPNGVPPAPAPRAITRQQQNIIDRVPQITDMLIDFSVDDPIETAADYRRIANILRDPRNAREFLEDVMDVGSSLGDFVLRASDVRSSTLRLVADELESRAANMAVPGGPLMTDNELYNSFTDIIRAAIRDEDFEPANYSNADLAMLVADDQIGGLDDLTPEQRARLAMIVRERGFGDVDANVARADDMRDTAEEIANLLEEGYYTETPNARAAVRLIRQHLRALRRNGEMAFEDILGMATTGYEWSPELLTALEVELESLIERYRGMDDYANGGPVRGYKKGGSVEADEQAAFGIYPSAGKRRQKSDIGDKLNASLVPQDALDLALTIAPFGKAGKALATAILAGAPTEAQAGNMSSLLKLVAREAPEQFQSIREALLRTFNTGLEHSVIGSTRTGGPSQVVQGKEISVIPSKADIAKAKQNLGQSGLIDFHTHPNAANLGLLEPEFRIRPSDADLQYWMSNYGGRRTATTPNEIKTMIGTPPNRQEGVTSSYNFFATDKPNQTLDRRAYDAARYELQRSKPLQALKDNPVVGQYLDAGGTFGDVIGSASPMLLQKFYAQKGLGRHDMRLSNAPTSAPTVTESNLFNEIVNPAMEVLDSKKFGSFADGGIVQQNPTTDQMRYELMMRRK